MSALAAVSLSDGRGPLLLDLADLAFDAPAPVCDALLGSGRADGYIPWFPSSDPAYSYLRLEGDRVTETAEKSVISNAASAGVYGFARPDLFLTAAASSLANPDAHRVNGTLFVCPAYNVLIRSGATVRAGEVTNVRAYSKTFHAGAAPNRAQSVSAQNARPVSA